jgi:hypothetical protein
MTSVTFTQAHLTSLKRLTTPLGQRIYAVFKTVEGSEVGIWTSANHKILAALKMGDVVFLKRNAQGHLELAPTSLFSGQPMSNLAQFLAFLQHFLQHHWRLL